MLAYNKKIVRLLICSVFVFFSAGCTSAAAPTVLASATVLPTQSFTPAPTSTATAAPTAIPLVTGVCSPLSGISLSSLPSITSNPFYFKYPFSEGPANDKNHPAVDLAFYSSNTIANYQGSHLTTDDGYPIDALLPGKVVEVVENRFPYGNMILIETPLDSLSPELITRLDIKEHYSEQELQTRFPCDKTQPPITYSSESTSIYTLYAHMKEPAPFKAGDQIICGEQIGAIGATGNTSMDIEHLHLEIRVGPSNASFGTIAYSSNTQTATSQERYNYCIWAWTERFYPIDPSLFWKTTGD